MTPRILRERLEKHATVCRAARAAGLPRPQWEGSLQGADLHFALLSGANLSGLDLRLADLGNANLSDTDLSGADLRRADLVGVALYNADLSRTKLDRASLSEARLVGARLASAKLAGARLQHADLSGADLSGADLSGADLSGADLSGADLSGADLCGAHLRDATLVGAIICEGRICASVAGNDGGYSWNALRLEDGTVILQYGCERAPLQHWLQRGPEYSDRHGHKAGRWEHGPAVAIAAAARLREQEVSMSCDENVDTPALANAIIEDDEEVLKGEGLLDLISQKTREEVAYADCFLHAFGGAE